VRARRFANSARNAPLGKLGHDAEISHAAILGDTNMLNQIRAVLGWDGAGLVGALSRATSRNPGP
jgi:hypothetical protein